MKTITLEGQIGEHINNYAERLVKYRKNKDSRITKDFIIEGSFNGCTLKVGKDSTTQSILTDFNNQLQINHQNYINSDKYKEQQRKETIELTRLNQESEVLMDKFNTLDFNDFKQVLLWLVEMQPYSDRIGVITPKEQILSTLRLCGYESNVNCGKEFNGENPENFAKYIIGQCMDGLERVGAIHYMAVKFTEDWKAKFQ